MSPAELLKKFDLENNALDFVTFNFSECDENLEKLETYLKNLQLQIEEIDPSNQFHSELLSIENDMIELRLLIKYFI